MPFEILSLIEALAAASSLVPTEFERKYRTLASATSTELLCALETAMQRDPFRAEADEQSRFKAAKSKLVELVSNSPEPGFPLHEALKPILTRVLEVSRALTTGTITREQAGQLVEQLRSHIATHHTASAA